MLLEEGEGTMYPRQTAVEVVVILQQGDKLSVRETDGLVVGAVLIQVVGPHEKLVGSCQRTSQSTGMLLARPVVDDDDLDILELP